jgi:hypothetical protein
LLESDDNTVIEKHDAELAALERQISIHQDRIVALNAQLRREHIEEVAKRRQAAIEVLEQKFAKRQALAVEVEAAVKHLGDVWAALLASRTTIVSDWDDTVFPRPRQDDLKSRIDRECAWALWSAGRPTALSPCKIPAPSNEGLGIIGIHPRGIAGAIDLEHQVMLDRLRNLPLPDGKPEMEAA